MNGKISRNKFYYRIKTYQLFFLLFSTLLKGSTWAVVVAQLVERLLPIPEVRGSNPVIGKTLFKY